MKALNFKLIVLLLFSGSSVLGQHKPAKFGSEILAYSIIGHSINKQPNLIIIDSKGIKIEDRDSCFQILGYGNQEQYVTTAYVRNGDTIGAQQYNYRFLLLPDPKIHWTALDKFRLSQLPNEEYNTVGLHRDSLEYLKEFEIHHFVPNIPELKWEVVKATLYMPGMRGRPPTFKGGNSLPDSFIDSLKTLGDTIGFSMNVSIRGEDNLTRQIGGSIRLIKLDGVQYEVHRDPWYFIKNYSDTLQITKKQLFSEDTLTLHNPGRLYLKLPRLKKDYYIKWYSDIAYYYDPPDTKIEAGKGFAIIDAFAMKGEQILMLRYEKDSSSMDPKTFELIDNNFIKKKIFFTYPDPFDTN